MKTSLRATDLSRSQKHTHLAYKTRTRLLRMLKRLTEPPILRAPRQQPRLDTREVTAQATTPGKLFGWVIGSGTLLIPSKVLVKVTLKVNFKDSQLRVNLSQSSSRINSCSTLMKCCFRVRSSEGRASSSNTTICGWLLCFSDASDGGVPCCNGET